MQENHLVSLIVRRWTGELDSQGMRELEEWAMQNPANRQLFERVSKEAEVRKEINLLKQIDPARGYNKWLAYWQAKRKARIIRIASWSVAASLLAAVIITSVTHRAGPTISSGIVAKEIQVAVLPGRNTATLTLANGRQILLDSVGNGQLTVQGNTRLVKADTGSINYVPGVNNSPDAETYNILTTPRAGQYQLTLPDGSRVWLNNVSSLRYPTSFQGKKRIVELTGEAYFEVAKDATKPFIVRGRDEEVEVLGTSFNIMAYPEEGGTQTTLLTGAVRVSTSGAAVQLNPGEQAEVMTNGGLKILIGVPSEDIVSWKNGFFYFGRATFANMIRQLARWYDVEVVYQGKVPDVEFAGKLDRSLPLNELLKFLDKNQIHLRLEGRKLIVLPS
jgi:transmembrane sensor